MFNGNNCTVPGKVMVSWRNSQLQIAAVHLKNIVQRGKAFSPMYNSVFMPPISMSNSTWVSWIQEFYTREVMQATSLNANWILVITCFFNLLKPTGYFK